MMCILKVESNIYIKLQPPILVIVHEGAFYGPQARAIASSNGVAAQVTVTGIYIAIEIIQSHTYARQYEQVPEKLMLISDLRNCCAGCYYLTFIQSRKR